MNTHNPNDPDKESQPADDFVNEFRGSLQDQGMYTSHEKTGPTSGKMKITLSRQKEKEIAVKTYTQMIESAFDSMSKLTTEGQKNFTRQRIANLINDLEGAGGDGSSYRTLLEKPETQN